MNIKIVISNTISKYNPIAIHRRKRMRKMLTNQTPSLLIPNCLGGHLFHDLGIQFCSPFVNLMMHQTDFCKFILDLNKYLNEEPVFFKHPKYNFPCAKLDDLTVHFTHYDTEADALEKWNSRKARIDFDNLFIVLMERDGLTEADIRSLAQIKARGILVFTAHPYPDIPYTCYVPSLNTNAKGTDLLKRFWWDDHKRYEDYFDFIQWFNEANGGEYNVEPYIKPYLKKMYQTE
ncbi:MAG: DUF1919 domain-containing protein [Ruminococcus sp.]